MPQPELDLAGVGVAELELDSPQTLVLLDSPHVLELDSPQTAVELAPHTAVLLDSTQTGVELAAQPTVLLVLEPEPPGLTSSQSTAWPATGITQHLAC